MSILLDALKKSETLRQLGKTPTIHSAVEDPDANLQVEQQWIALSMLGLSAVAIAWFSWQQYREPPTTLDAVGVDIVEVPEVAVAPVADIQAQQDTRQQSGGSQTPATSPWNIQNDVRGITVIPAKVPEQSLERKEQLNQSFSSYEAEKEPVADPDTNGIAVANTPSDPAMAKPVVEEAPAVTESSSSSGLQVHQPEPISFWQIPQALREQLPELRINVLVYAEKPEDRFLLINGERLEEKDELVDGVVLDEIRRDGAVFKYRKYRFLVKG